ncbi:MAG: hypothetical protein V3T02_02305 [Alphaproteobacteria bacterium]
MKFLIFNVAVAAALFYLLTTDRGEFQRVAGSLHDAAGGIRTMTERAVGKGRKLLDRTVSGPRHGGGDAPGTGPTPASLMVAKTAGARPARSAMEPPPPPPPAIPAPNRPAPPRGQSDVTSTAAAKPPRKDPAVVDPAVAKRRDEIFAGIAPEPKGPALKQGEPMMTPEQRRKELFSLAEEMELLYARTVSR